MVAFELFAIAHNLNAELSTLGITSKEAENDSSLYDHLIVNESLREKTRELYFDGHYTRVIEEAFKLIDNLVKEKASIAPSSSLTGSKLMQMAFSRERPLLRLNQGSSASDAYCAVFATPFHAPLLQRSMADCHVAMRVALIARGAQAPLLANTAGYALSRCACALTRRLQYG